MRGSYALLSDGLFPYLFTLQVNRDTFKGTLTILTPCLNTLEWFILRPLLIGRLRLLLWLAEKNTKSFLPHTTTDLF